LNDAFKIVIAIFLYAIINTIYVRYFDIMGIKPNINAIIIVLIGLNMGMTKGMWYGLYLGFLVDMLIGTNLGLNALIYMYIGYISGALAKKMYNENIFISAVAIMLADIFYSVVIYFTYYLPKDYGFLKYAIRLLLPEAVYTLGIYLTIYALMGLFRKRTSF